MYTDTTCATRGERPAEGDQTSGEAHIAPPAGWEKLFRIAFRGSDSPMMLLTEGRIVLAINPAFSRALGYASSSIVNSQADASLAPTMRAEVRSDWAILARTGKLRTHRLWRHQRGGYSQVEIDLHSAALGARILVLCVVTGVEPPHDLPATTGQEAGEPRREADAHQGGSALTKRELEVVTHISLGRRLPEIAAQLFISPATVRSHVRNAMTKTKARTQAQLVAVAITEKMIDPPLPRAT